MLEYINTLKYGNIKLKVRDFYASPRLMGAKVYINAKK